VRVGRTGRSQFHESHEAEEAGRDGSSPKVSGAIPLNRVTRATIAFLESDRLGVPGPDDPHGDTANVMARSRAPSSSVVLVRTAPVGACI
jgi:hypothetical protein